MPILVVTSFIVDEGVVVHHVHVVAGLRMVSAVVLAHACGVCLPTSAPESACYDPFMLAYM